jgi:hypothetical protein
VDSYSNSIPSSPTTLRLTLSTFSLVLCNVHGLRVDILLWLMGVLDRFRSQLSFHADVNDIDASLCQVSRCYRRTVPETNSSPLKERVTVKFF